MTPWDRKMLRVAVASAGIGLAVAVWTRPSDETLTGASATPIPTSLGAGPTTVATPPATLLAAAAAPAPSSPAPASMALPSSTIAPTTTRDPNAPRSVSMFFTGDILAENPVLDAGRRAAATTGARYDFAPLFAPIAPLVQSYDLAVCQMETPIGRPGEAPGAKGRSPHGGNRLLAPFELVTAIAAAGFDRCTTASNHSYDVGDAGVDSTIDAMAGAGISWSGTARRPDELPPPVFDVNGVRVAHLSYTRYSNTALPADEWRLAYTDNPARVAREVDEARAAGAEIVVVSIHLSKELRTEPLSETRVFAEAIIGSTQIDAVIHHGPHVVQGVEVLDGTPVWWSVGNLLSGMARPNATDRYTDPRTRDGLGAGLVFTETAPGVWDAVASSVVLCNEAAGRTIHAGVTASQDPTLTPAARAELAGCVERTRVAVPDAG